MREEENMMEPRFARALVAACTMLAVAGAWAQSYPTQPVKIVVGYAAGGVADITARVLAQKLSEQIGQQVIIDNRPSAGQIVASEAVMKAEPDGYTLIWLNSGHSVSGSLFKSLPYDPVKDFAPISTVGSFGMVLAVNADSPYRTLQDFIAAAKAAPGKINVGTTTPGGTQFIAADLFRSMAGIDFQIVPYKATPAIITSLRGKDLHAMVEILAPMLPQIRSGTLRALAVTFDHRFPGLPDVPTIAESGVTGYEATAWNAVAGPAKLPKAIVDRLNREVRAAVADPALKSRLLELGVDTRASTPEELRAHVISEMAKWKVVIERANIEKQ